MVPKVKIIIETKVVTHKGQGCDFISQMQRIKLSMKNNALHNNTFEIL